MVKVRGAGVKIDTEFLKDELASLKEEAEKEFVNEARTVLKKYLTDLRAASSNRESQLQALGVETVNLGSKDDPLQKHYVSVRKRGNITRVFVAQRGSHTGGNIFTGIDKGRPAGGQRPMVFPQYDGNVTNIDSLNVNSGAVKLRTKVVKDRRTKQKKEVPMMAVLVKTKNTDKKREPIPARNIYAAIGRHLTKKTYNIQSKGKTLKLKTLRGYVTVKEVLDGE